MAIIVSDFLEPRLGKLKVFDAIYTLQWPVNEQVRSDAFRKAYYGGSLLDKNNVDAVLQKHQEANWRKEFDAASALSSFI